MSAAKPGCPSCPALPKLSLRLPPELGHGFPLERLPEGRAAAARQERSPLYRCVWCGSQFDQFTPAWPR